MTIPMRRREFLSTVAASSAVFALPPDGTTASLFDGKSLAGWQVIDGPESAFYVDNSAIVIHPGSGFPSWLRTTREFENFDFTCEVFIQGWANSGIFFCAPLHGRPTEVGFKLNLFQKQDDPPLKESIGAIFPVAAPKLVNVKSKGEWNSVRIQLDWPSLKVWMNDALVQDLDCSANPEFRYRRRSGSIGIESLSYPLRFRNLQIKELPSKERWTTLYNGPADMEQWELIQKPKYEALGEVLRGDGLGYLATKKSYQNFEFDCYVRASYHSNGGIIFRAASEKTEEHYEIQLHDVEGAVYPTGSLYHYARCQPYPRIVAEQWYPFYLRAEGKRCVVRINGDTVVDYDKLERLTPGKIMLQAHQLNKWVEYKRIRIREL